MSLVFCLVSQDGSSGPAVVFKDSASAGCVPVWEAAGVYDALYNSDGQEARAVSRVIAFGVDRLHQDPRLARLLPPTVSLMDAIRFLENVLRGCTIHASSTVETR
ncbi:hypothetical protein [Massilia sp. S19_KUP03_FR1]|uniref:hypothetical protein n=1 Tax=Massilia sp. S19_KUP03_FR1 TaxID=3025503 RepID=UPI002FCD171C